jgi:truncated hemoglobin YjbI
MPRRGFSCVFLLALTGCMEGTKPEKDRLERTLYSRLGGEAGITKVVDDFVDAVVKNDKYPPKLKDHFKRPDVSVLKRKPVDQIGQATGGPAEGTPART